MRRASAPDHPLEAIALELCRVAKPHGYALLVFDDGEILYASNGRRGDVVELVRDWHARGMQADRGEAPRAKRARFALQGKCATIGRALAKHAALILFLFDVHTEKNQPAHVAYFTNRKHMRSDLDLWLDHVEPTQPARERMH